MAPKRSVRNVCGRNNNNNYNNLTLNDVLCPICRSILIEPVTLPCNHGFCSSCFDGTIANANLVCPLCRVRIGSWLRRTSKKDNKLINSVLWEVIQRNFPEQVKNKLEGNEDYPEEVDLPKRLATPGEIRREYEIQKAKELLELQKQQETEALASEEYIRKLKEEEEFEESMREKNLRLSEQVARKLAQEYSFDPGPSSSKINVQAPSSSKKQGPIERLFKNMTQKKLSVTVQPITENSTITKDYTCKILCQDRIKESGNHIVTIDKATLLNWKIQDKLKKIVTEGEASDSNDSITSECRYFKPIDQRHIPLSMKAPVIKVPGRIATANTVIIGPPKGDSYFTHASVGSAFAMVRIIALPLVVPENEIVIKKSSPLKRKAPRSGSICDMISTEAATPEESPSTSFDIRSPKRQTRSKAHTTDFRQITAGSAIKEQTRNKTLKTEEKTPEKSRNLSLEFATYTTPSKRKRLRSSPCTETIVSPKRTRIAVSNAVGSPPFRGFPNKNVNEHKTRNGAIAFENVSVNNLNSKFNNGDIKNNLKKLQEDEDLKFAKKLHEELNCRGRYSTRNSISVQTKNVRKSTARQVTLQEIISQTANKVP